MAKIHCFHKRYCLGDSHEYNTNDFSSWTEFKEQIEKDYDVAIILPLYMYDHSGITVSTQPFNCQWDSGQVGWVFITKETIRNEYSVKHITKSVLQKALTVLLGEVEVYDQYLQGEIYSFDLVEIETCEHYGETHETIIDSCGGFFGHDFKKNGLLDTLNEGVRVEIESKL